MLDPYEEFRIKQDKVHDPDSQWERQWEKTNHKIMGAECIELGTAPKKRGAQRGSIHTLSNRVISWGFLVAQLGKNRLLMQR